MPLAAFLGEKAKKSTELKGRSELWCALAISQQVVLRWPLAKPRCCHSQKGKQASELP